MIKGRKKENPKTKGTVDLKFEDWDLMFRLPQVAGGANNEIVRIGPPFFDNNYDPWIGWI